MSALAHQPAPEGASVPDDGVQYVGAVVGGRSYVAIVPGRAELPPRHDLYNHSPTGFSWGYLGSGPAQLALALLAHATGDDAQALRLHQSFKLHWVSGQPQDRGWSITAAEIRKWAHAIDTARSAHG